MNRQEKVNINDQDFTLQSVSISWYYDINDRFLSGKQRRSAGYIDALLRGVVVEPLEVKNKGLAYFEETGDLATVEMLVARIEKFLRSTEKPASGVGASEKA